MDSTPTVTVRNGRVAESRPPEGSAWPQFPHGLPDGVYALQRKHTQPPAAGDRVYDERSPARHGTVLSGATDERLPVRWDDGFSALYEVDVLCALTPPQS